MGRQDFEIEHLVQTYVEEEFMCRLEANRNYKLPDLAKAKELVPEIYWEFLPQFSKTASEHLPSRKPWDHIIELKSDFKPRRAPLYPLSWEEKEELDEWIEIGRASCRERV